MSEENETISFNDDVLKKLIAALGNIPEVRVGILGANDTRSLQVQGDDGKLTTQHSSNAEVGAAHEFGTSTMPRRSFLRQPLSEHLGEALEQSGAFTEDVLKEVIKLGDVTPWMRKVAVQAEAVVAEAFATQGYGKWPAHAPGYTNNTGQVLIDTQQLRNSISSEVKGK